MKLSTRCVLSVVACLWAADSDNTWAQQDYPNRPIRIIVPFPPGGSTDPMARMVAAKLMERWGGTIVVASILKSPETVGFIARQGSEPLIADPSETTALIKEDVERYGKIVKAATIKWSP